MSNAYRMVQWNRHKRVYDACVAGSVLVYVGAFVGVSIATQPAGHEVSPAILAMRALGTCALAMLHVILWIGPLARLSPRFAPLLYNRRHLGVTMFGVALLHALIATGYYGAFGVDFPLRAVLAHGSIRSVAGFPFEWLGLGALLILALMASTSHDFWLANLSPKVWKSLHMLVYGAYALLILHVLLGPLRSEPASSYRWLLLAGVGVTAALHTITGWRELTRDSRGAMSDPADRDDWIPVARVGEIPDSRAKVVCLRGRERVAIFRDADSYSALANVCAHQGGPLGEGKIVGGCVTCPWHGYQYLAKNGQSPPPFTEKVPTYELRIRGEWIELNPRALAPGTPVEPATARVDRGGEGGPRYA